MSIHKATYETYRWENKDEGNPYRFLEGCNDFSIMQDATSYWGKQLNTVMLRVVIEETDIMRVPFSFKNVAYLTGEVLCYEITDIISSIKKVKGNAFEKISDALKEEKLCHATEAYHEICEKLKIAAGKADFELMAEIPKK